MREVGKPKKLLGLQHLRGIAVILTVLAHLPSATWIFEITALPSPLWLGVCVFYGISGYIIYLTTETVRFDGVASFYARRLSRIMPVLAFSLAISILLAVAVAHGPIVDQFYPPVDQMAHVAAGHLVLFGNLQSVTQAPAPISTLGLWTVSTEAHFYLFFGLILAVPQRFRGVALIGTATALLVAKALLLPPHMLRSHVFFYEIMFAGAAVCHYRSRLPVRGAFLLAAGLYIAAFPYLGFIMPVAERASVFLAAYGSLCIAIAYVVLGCASTIPGVRHGGVWDRTLSWAGDRSYVIYVLHFQVLAIAGMMMQLAGVNFWNGAVYGWGLTLAVVAAAPVYDLVHRTVERAGIGFGRRVAAFAVPEAPVTAPPGDLVPQSQTELPAPEPSAQRV